MPERALVLGGGFAGLEAAIHLRDAGLDVTLVSNRPYLFVALSKKKLVPRLPGM
ncbi:MAG TPA: FAD-dependent oxidoreductase [Anaeromyxobacter sp.]